jgi:uncharacterized membrane protein
MDFSQIFGSIMPFAERLPVVRAILGFILVFFLPGFVWTLVFFNRLNIVERKAHSLGLSMAVVTLSILVMNVFLDVRITGANSLLIIIVIIVVALVVYALKRFAFHKKAETNGD